MGVVADKLRKMWDLELMNTSKSGIYYNQHPEMKGHWDNAETLKNELLAEIAALEGQPTTPVFSQGVFSDGTFGGVKSLLSRVKNFFSRKSE